jgi:hypothetical protein
MASSVFKETRERAYEWPNNSSYGGYPPITVLPASTLKGSGLNALIDEWCEKEDRTSSSNISPANGDKQMSEVVVHSLGGKYGWTLTRREKEDSERYEVSFNGCMVGRDRPWNEAYKAVEEFLNEAEAAREALLELAVYKRASKPDGAPKGAKKGKKK